jgi:pyridoxine 5-phosphate synthase
MPKLGVNIDHIATIRELRKTLYPDLLEALKILEEAGADGIVCHLREDRRHMQDDDVRAMRKHARIPLNLEMAATPEMQRIAREIKPRTITLVPEKREELTTEGGLDVAKYWPVLRDYIEPFEKEGITVSLFIEPQEEQIRGAHRTGARVIELHTGAYSLAIDEEKRKKELEKIRRASEFAHSLGLFVACGHGLHYTNTEAIRKACPLIEEYNIGHAIVARAVFTGLSNAVSQMKEIVG